MAEPAAVEKARETGSRDIVGWREWVAFPALDLPLVKAKIDTGARTSSLHAYDVEFFDRDGCKMVRFRVHPRQKDARESVVTEAEMIDMRYVRDSGGKQTLRPVIVAEAHLGGVYWPIEITLSNRDNMGFRLLLGREAVRGRFLVDPGRSFLKGRHQKSAVGKKSSLAKTGKKKKKSSGQRPK